MEVAMARRRHARMRSILTLAIATLLAIVAARGWHSASFVAGPGTTLAPPQAPAAASELSPMTSRRTAALMTAVGATVMPVSSVVARPPGGRRMKPGEKAPEELEEDKTTDKSFEETWIAVDVGESNVVDPNDPKYKQLRILKELEKQQKKNEEFDSMTKEEKADKMCELLGRGCS